MHGVDDLERIREAEGYRKGQLEGLDKAIDLLVDAGLVSKEECKKEVDRYFWEEFEYDDRYRIGNINKRPTLYYEFCKIEQGRLKGRRAGLDEGVNAIVDAQLANRKECDRVIQPYRWELDKRIQDMTWNNMAGLAIEQLKLNDHMQEAYEQGYVYGVLETFSKGGPREGEEELWLKNRQEALIILAEKGYLKRSWLVNLLLGDNMFVTDKERESVMSHCGQLE